MEFRTAAGLDIPSIGLGTMRLLGEECRRAVGDALAAGYRHIDTARKYGNEEDVGAALRSSGVSRDEILLVTKLWHDELSTDAVRVAVADSLRRLEVDYLDVLLVHWPSRQVPLSETMEALVRAKEEGQARRIGVANFPASLFEQVADTPGLIGNQVEYHPYLSQAPLLSIARDQGLVLTAYCPLGRGGDLLRDPVLERLAADRGRTVAQIVLRWLLQQPRVVAIPGTGRREHMRENLDVFDFTLSDGEMATIHALARRQRVVDPPHAPDWDA